MRFWISPSRALMSWPMRAMRRASWRLRNLPSAAASWLLSMISSATALSREPTSSLSSSMAVGAGGRAGGRREQGQHAGVEAVGLGQDAVRLGEEAHAQRIDHGDREAGGVQAAAQDTMPFASGLDGHEPDIERRQPALEGADAGGRIGHPHRHP